MSGLTQTLAKYMTVFARLISPFENTLSFNSHYTIRLSYGCKIHMNFTG